MADKVVLVLTDARQVKGLVEEFEPSAGDRVTLVQFDDTGRVRGEREIDPASIRAAFFVRDLAFWRTFRMPEAHGPEEVDVEPLNGERRVDIELEWGERLHGIARPHDAAGRWYVFVPTGDDRAGNLVHAMIAADAIEKMEEWEGGSGSG